MKKLLTTIITTIMCSAVLCSPVSAFTVEDISSEEIFTPEVIERENAELKKQEDAEGQITKAIVFIDVSAGDYYYEPVKWAVKNGITNGTTTTTFSPDDTCTNAQILTIMWRAAGCPEPVLVNPFNNVTGEEYYAKAAVWAYEKNIITGKTFDADKPCTRAMTMEYFWKQVGSPEITVSDKFVDVAADAYYAQAVAWAVANDVTTGTSDNTFTPDNTCTRGQIVTFLYRVLV